jgi:hypothetical protein
MLRLVEGLQSNPVEGKQSPKEKAAWEKLIAAYKATSADDRKAATALVERAKIGKRDAAVVTLNPGTAAVLFFDTTNRTGAGHTRILKAMPAR